VGAAFLVGVAVVGSVLQLQGHPSGYLPDSYFQPWCRMAGLALGCLGAYLLAYGGPAVNRVVRRPAFAATGVLLYAGAVLSIALTALPDREARLLQGPIPVADVGAAMVVTALAAVPDSRLALALRRPFLVRSGELCYSIYLAHLPISLVILYATGLPLWAASPLAVLASIVAGWICHVVAEQPALDLAARLKPGNARDRPRLGRAIGVTGAVMAATIGTAVVAVAAKPSLPARVSNRLVRAVSGSAPDVTTSSPRPGNGP
jgi:peptidoglycan/LPS O-acetylase OafA/YrhL